MSAYELFINTANQNTLDRKARLIDGLRHQGFVCYDPMSDFPPVKLVYLAPSLYKAEVDPLRTGLTTRHAYNQFAGMVEEAVADISSRPLLPGATTVSSFWFQSLGTPAEVAEEEAAIREAEEAASVVVEEFDVRFQTKRFREVANDYRCSKEASHGLPGRRLYLARVFVPLEDHSFALIIGHHLDLPMMLRGTGKRIRRA